ncbi:MAG: DUF47 family protein [Myxococcota bacterium]
MKWLLPREEHFFDLLEKGADCALTSATLLRDCCAAQSYAEREGFVSKMREAEHAADKVIHEVYEALNRTFVTPLDRSDIYELATQLENITDLVNATGQQVVVHAMDDVPAGSLEIAKHIVSACEHLQAAVRNLRGLKQLDQIRQRCKAVYQLEHDGDQVFRQRIGELFRTEKDAIHLLKHKEFLESLEHTLDVCDDVANALETVVIKNA